MERDERREEEMRREERRVEEREQGKVAHAAEFVASICSINHSHGRRFATKTEHNGRLWSHLILSASNNHPLVHTHTHKHTSLTFNSADNEPFLRLCLCLCVCFF